MKISFGYNAVPVSARESILKVFESGQFSPGPRVREFEVAFAKMHGSRHGVFVSSGTDALRVGLMALKEKHGWPAGTMVAVPSLTFVASVNVILQAGLVPFFVDVGMYDYTMNGANLEWRLRTGQGSDRVKAMMPVHLFGQVVSPSLFAMARERKWAVLEDSCETILNNLRGDVSCYSTYMAHHIPTGVGGMALTNDAELNLLMRSYANHGRNTAYVPGYASIGLSKDLLRKRFRFERVGYSCRGTEFEAVLGLSQLPFLVENIRRRRLVASWLYRALRGFRELQLPVFTAEHTFMMFPIVLVEGSKTDKYDLCLSLEESGVETRDMMPITNQPCYRGIVDENSFTVARHINRSGFYIPCHPGMSEKDVKVIADVFGRVLDKTVIGV